MIAYTHYSPKAKARPYGSGWWSKARNEKLLYVMEKYNDVAKAARVLGCRECDVVKQLSFLKHVMSTLPGTNANENSFADRRKGA